MYGGGDVACRKILVGDSSEEWLMIVVMCESRGDGGLGCEKWGSFMSRFLGILCRGRLRPRDPSS